MFGHAGHHDWYLWFLQDVEAVAFLVTGLVLFRRGGVAALAGVGAALSGVVVAVYAVAQGQLIYSNSYSIAEHLVQHHIDTWLSTLRVLGVVVLALGLLAERRPRAGG